MAENGKSEILVVDDDSSVLSVTAALLEAKGYAVDACGNPEEAVDLFREKDHDMVLSDIIMPRITGLELLERLLSVNEDVPVVLMTAYAGLEIAIDAIHRGAFDFILKPYDAGYLINRVNKAARYGRLIKEEKSYKARLETDVKERVQELAEALKNVKEMGREMMQRLLIASEFRDAGTGAHIRRVGLYAGMISDALDMAQEFRENLTIACQMHDLGKIGSPDGILLKPAALTDEEMTIMRKHASMGAKMLSGSNYELPRMAARVAASHHERYDGTGYPDGLKGEKIPVEGRITTVADIYDALRSGRPYRRAFSHQEAFKIITEGDGRTMPSHFDPKVLKAFISLAPKMNEIFEGVHE